MLFWRVLFFNILHANQLVLCYYQTIYFLYRIYAGYNKSLRIFDVHRPGRDFKQHSTLQRDKEGQSGNFLFSIYYCLWFFANKLENFNFDDGAFIGFWSYLVDNLLCAGIISSIAFSPSCTGMLATGSYSQTTGIYREDNMELLYVLHGQEGGVTHVSWNLSFREFFLWVEKEGILFNAFFFFLQLFFDLSAPIF